MQRRSASGGTAAARVRHAEELEARKRASEAKEARRAEEADRKRMLRRASMWAEVLAKRARVAEQVKDNTCPICLDAYVDPVRLLCNHVFCGACLREHELHSDKPPFALCPLCRNVYLPQLCVKPLGVIPGGVPAWLQDE